MPIYEYRCEACSHELESLQKMSDPALVECPKCGKATLKKLISAAGFRLTGTGWYATDFKGASKKDTAKSGQTEGSSATSEAKTEAKTELKAETKAETKTETKSASIGSSKE